MSSYPGFQHTYLSAKMISDKKDNRERYTGGLGRWKGKGQRQLNFNLKYKIKFKNYIKYNCLMDKLDFVSFDY